MEMKRFNIVCFPDEDNSVGIVPNTWCIGNTECFWPPYKTDARIRKAVKMLEEPDNSWAVLKIRCLGTKGTYERAHAFLEKAEETSDLQTEDECGDTRRKRRQNTRYLNGVGEDESEDDAGGQKKPRTTLPKAPKPPLLSAAPPQTSNSIPPGSSLDSPLALQGDDSGSSDVQRAALLCSPLPGSSIRTDIVHLSPSLSAPVTQTGCRPGQQSLENNSASIMTALQLLIKVVTRIDFAVKELQVAQRNRYGNLNSDYTLPDNVVIPAGNKEQLAVLEDAVQGDKELEKYLITSLASRGGQNVQECIKRMLGNIITNTFMKDCNWTGQGDKTEFRKLKIRNILERAIRRNNHTKDATRTDRSPTDLLIARMVLLVQVGRIWNRTIRATVIYREWQPATRNLPEAHQGSLGRLPPVGRQRSNHVATGWLATSGPPVAGRQRSPSGSLRRAAGGFAHRPYSGSPVAATGGLPVAATGGCHRRTTVGPMGKTPSGLPEAATGRPPVAATGKPPEAATGEPL